MFDLADIWAARSAEAVRLVSANDHIHARGSAHYAGLALDFQSSNPDALSSMFRLAGYRVLWRVPGHVHVEQQRSSDPSLSPPRGSRPALSHASVRFGGGLRFGG
jgi:hypothetical protein